MESCKVGTYGPRCCHSSYMFLRFVCLVACVGTFHLCTGEGPCVCVCVMSLWIPWWIASWFFFVSLVNSAYRNVSTSTCFTPFWTFWGTYLGNEFCSQMEILDVYPSCVGEEICKHAVHIYGYECAFGMCVWYVWMRMCTHSLSFVQTLVEAGKVNFVYLNSPPKFLRQGPFTEPGSHLFQLNGLARSPRDISVSAPSTGVTYAHYYAWPSP